MKRIYSVAPLIIVVLAVMVGICGCPGTRRRRTSNSSSACSKPLRRSFGKFP